MKNELQTEQAFPKEFFRSRAFMRKESLGVTFFFRPYVCPTVRPYVCKFWESPSVSVQCLSSGPEVVWKWTGSGPEVDRKWTSVRPVSVWWTGSGPYARDLQTQGTCAL